MTFNATLMLKEKHRWSYMSAKELATRLGRITNLDKLDCFLNMARRQGNTTLLTAAQARQRLLLGEPEPGRTVIFTREGNDYKNFAVVSELPGTINAEAIHYDWSRTKGKTKPRVAREVARDAATKPKRVDGGNGRGRPLRRLDI